MGEAAKRRTEWWTSRRRVRPRAVEPLHGGGSPRSLDTAGAPHPLSSHVYYKVGRWRWVVLATSPCRPKVGAPEGQHRRPPAPWGSQVHGLAERQWVP
eukprot:6728259-Pyramimonas_sp.AAC.1